jgi:hypothetical protein
VAEPGISQAAPSGGPRDAIRANAVINGRLHPRFDRASTSSKRATVWPDDPAATREALKFFAWAFANGDRLAEQLLYAPMPGKVVGAIHRLWAAEIRDASGRPLLARPN